MVFATSAVTDKNSICVDIHHPESLYSYNCYINHNNICVRAIILRKLLVKNGRPRQYEICLMQLKRQNIDCTF